MSGKFDEDVTQCYMDCLVWLISVDVGSEALTNPRGIACVVAACGEETGFEEDSLSEGLDVIALAFQPGHEEQGPRNIAVFEMRDGNMNVWPNCAFCTTANGKNFLVDHEDRIAFVVSGKKILIVNNLPKGFYRENADRGFAFLRDVATDQLAMRRAVGFQGT